MNASTQVAARSQPAGAISWLPTPRQIAIVLLVCAAVYFPRLGADGLTSTEGHRAIPAWEMMESGSIWVPTLFEQVYLRKPPGIAWGIAASSSLFGQTEFAARAVSAGASTVMAIVALFFAARWFGRRWALAGGLAQALLPLAWKSGRTAEIEPLHNMAVQIAMLLLVHGMIESSRPRNDARGGAVRILIAAFAGVSIAAAGLVKGPAGVPGIVGVVVGVCLAMRSIRPAIVCTLPVAITVAACVLLPLAVQITDAVREFGGSVVWQSPGDFLWRPDRIVGVLLVAPVAFFATMPVTIPILVPWGRDSRAETADPQGALRRLTARALSLAWIASIAVYLMLGVDNVRYVAPAAGLLAPLAAYAAAAAFDAGPSPRRFILRSLTLHHSAVLPMAFFIAAMVWVWGFEGGRDARSGRSAGVAVGKSIAEQVDLPDSAAGVEFWADHLVEARPELLWYASKEASRAGLTLRPLWVRQGRVPVLPPVGHLIALRTDDLSLEHLAFEGLVGRLRPIAEARVHKFTFTVFQVEGGDIHQSR